MSENKTKQIKEVIMNLSPAYEKWRQETLTEGEARGETRGETRGKKIGQEETRFSIAKNMLQEGADVAFVAKVTGLSVEEVELLGEV
jgi:predicted transposase/invertase (TIGR01784 family)